MLHRIVCFYFASILLCGTAAHAQSTNSLLDVDAMDITLLFSVVNQVIPSNVSIKEYEAIIGERTMCFARNFSYARRVKLCMEKYVRNIVSTSRSHISGRADIGLFVKHVAYCPSMYNFCMGQMDNDDSRSRDACVTFERQCIDYMLDNHWRGVPLYDNMQYRIK